MSSPDRVMIGLKPISFFFPQVVNNNGSLSGCPEKRDFCGSNPCKNGGVCTNGWGSYICTCPGGSWTGKNCGKPAGRIFGFKAGSQLEFQQKLEPIQLPWETSVSFKVSYFITVVIVKDKK